MISFSFSDPPLPPNESIKKSELFSESLFLASSRVIFENESGSGFPTVSRLSFFLKNFSLSLKFKRTLSDQSSLAHLSFKERCGKEKLWKNYLKF